MLKKNKTKHTHQNPSVCLKIQEFTFSPRISDYIVDAVLTSPPQIYGYTKFVWSTLGCHFSLFYLVPKRRVPCLLNESYGWYFITNI